MSRKKKSLGSISQFAQQNPILNESKPRREGISKGTRFRIFARDAFTCRYCGRQSDQVKLVVDHIIPVAAGGTNDDANLGCSCEECNQGKSDKIISSFAPSDSDRLRIAQELREQQIAAENAIELANIRKERRQMVCNYFCECVNRDSMNKVILSTLVNLADEHGLDTILEWIEIATTRTYSGSDTKIIKYIYGIRRNVKAQNQQ